MAVSIAIQVAAQTAQELEVRHKYNSFLDQINEALFKPRGLYCMIMTFKPDKPLERVLGQDVADAHAMALTQSTSEDSSGLSAKMKKLRLASGTSKGELSLPEPAPLVYPALDAAALQAANSSEPLSEKKQSALKDYGAFLSDYLDRRAQAEYAGTYTGTKLASLAPPPEKKFASRFSDPNHPANSGSIVALLTGGHVDLMKKKRARKARRRAWRRGVELTEQDIHNEQMGRKTVARQGLISKVMTKSILYLAIVNLPSQAQMDQVKDAMKEAETNAEEGEFAQAQSIE